MVTLHDDDFFTFTWERARGLARMVRKPRRLADLTEAERLFANLLAARARIPEAKIRLLIDQREAIGNNDPSFEAIVNKTVRLLMVGVSRVAVLVRSASGKLQAERLQRARSAAGETVAFHDEAEALAFLDAVSHDEAALPSATRSYAGLRELFHARPHQRGSRG
jgi:hypothetical protein